MAEQIISKRCSVCNETKPLSEFYKHSGKQNGHRACCKTCFLKYQTIGKGKELHKNAMQQYQQSPKGKESQRKRSKRYRETNKEKVRKSTLCWRQSERGKELYQKIKERYEQTEKGKKARCKSHQNYKHHKPNQVKAKNAVYSEVRAGRMAKVSELKCHYCPARAEQYHHHKGYAPEYWLDVVPVCIPCHNRIS